MRIIAQQYLKLFRNRDFLVLVAVTFIGQIASGFLLLFLLVTSYGKTHSNFEVSGVIVSFATPGFLLMAFAGLIADIADRRKIIIAANCAIVFVVLAILLSREFLLAALALSFLYFAGNTFFLPSSSAASAQLVRKKDLDLANSIFIFVLGAGIILGIFLGAVVHLLVSSFATLLICEGLLVCAAGLSFKLPKMMPRKKSKLAFTAALLDIWRAFTYIFRQKEVWFPFLIFASAQGLIAIGVTLAPGFFDNVVGLTVDKSPIFIFPLVGLGVLFGSIYVHRPKKEASFFWSMGYGAIGIAALLLGLVILSQFLQGILLLLPSAVFLVFLGFGEIIALISSRAALQKRVSHSYQGTVFGANIILSSFLAGIAAPLAALLEDLFGYVKFLVFGGLIFLLFSLFFVTVGRKWKF